MCSGSRRAWDSIYCSCMILHTACTLIQQCCLVARLSNSTNLVGISGSENRRWLQRVTSHHQYQLPPNEKVIGEINVEQLIYIFIINATLHKHSCEQIRMNWATTVVRVGRNNPTPVSSLLLLIQRSCRWLYSFIWGRNIILLLVFEISWNFFAVLCGDVFVIIVPMFVISRFTSLWL